MLFSAGFNENPRFEDETNVHSALCSPQLPSWLGVTKKSSILIDVAARGQGPLSAEGLSVGSGFHQVRASLNVPWVKMKWEINGYFDFLTTTTLHFFS